MFYVLHVITVKAWAASSRSTLAKILLHHLVPASTDTHFSFSVAYGVRVCAHRRTYIDAYTLTTTFTQFPLSHVHLTVCIPTLTFPDYCANRLITQSLYGKEQSALFRNNVSLFRTDIKSCLSTPRETERHQ